MTCVACPGGICRLGIRDCVGSRFPGYARKLAAGDQSFASILRQLSENRTCEGCHGDKPCVSIVIAARNCEPWLRDAILSAQHQTIPACEVIYSDDASTDGSVALARSLGCKVLIADRHEGVCAARNAGARLAKGEWLLHLDGDDILPRPYLEHKLHNFKRDPEASFVYSAAQAFGGEWNHYWDTPDWDAAKLWHNNWVNTSTLVRRDHFWLAGGWQEGIGTAWDWDLWLRLSQLGKRGVRDPHGFLLYRKHHGSVSFNQGLYEDSECVRMNYLVRCRLARLSVCCVLSDRLISFFPRWLTRVAKCVDHLMAAIRREEPYPHFGRIEPRAPGLVVLYTGDKSYYEFVSARINRVAHAFGNVSLVCDRFETKHDTEQQRRDQVATFLASAYNRFLDLPDELLWFVEDDILPPIDALTRMHTASLRQGPVFPVVSGWYRNRHEPDHLVLHEWANPPDLATLGEHHEPPPCDTLVDLVGTGCMLIFKPLVPHRFGSHVGPVAAHDWNWCLGMRSYHGREFPAKPLVLRDVACEHYQTRDVCV